MTETRAEAQRLVDEERVRIVHWTFCNEAQVQDKEHLYRTVLFRSGHFSCDCEWGERHSYTDDLCAHALAVRLAVEREKAR